MQKKLQLFYTLKFSSKRLRQAKYNLDLTLSQARLNGEVVSIGDSELLRLIRRMKGETLLPQNIRYLKERRNELKQSRDSIENRAAIQELNDKIDGLLFVKELVIIRFDNVAHYKHVANHGVIVNGRKYVRLMAGAGHTRRASVIFCLEDMYAELVRRLNNGRKDDLQMNMGKFGAYFALVSSASHGVSTPRFAVIPDYEFDVLTKIDMLEESHTDGIDHKIVETETTYTKNAFDGQGIISTSFASKWANELGLEYTPAHWVFRGVFLKGGLVTFDMIDFAIEHDAYIIKDIWGNEHDIFNLDVILSASQFKMASGYDSFQDYLDNCQRNGFGWGVSRHSSECERNYVRLNYQFIQVLDLQTDEEIDELCQPTIDWFGDVLGNDPRKTMLYLLGETTNSSPKAGWFSKLDVHAQLLLLEPTFIREPVVQQAVAMSLRRKIKDSRLGKLLVSGNYQAMVSDPVAQMQWALGLPVTGVLQEGEAYSKFWDGKHATKIAALRAPMTWRSEINVLNVSRGTQARHWLAPVSSGIVFNIFDDSMARMSGADFDGDMCMTTDNRLFIEKSFGGNIVSYERTSTGKERVSDGVAWESDVKSMVNRIGFITNVGTTYYAMLDGFSKGQAEYAAIINRLKLLCCFQSMEIDKTKGIATLDFPLWWTKWSKTTTGTSDERSWAYFNNGILCDKRPYFFRWLYKRYDTAYRKHIETYDNYCHAKFGMDIASLLASGGESEHQKKVVSNYWRFNPLIETDAPMNRVAKKMESVWLDAVRTKESDSILLSIIPEVIDTGKAEQMGELFRLYNTMRKGIHHSEQTTQQIVREIQSRAEAITSNSDELVFLSVHTDIRFALTVFKEELIAYIMKTISNKAHFPVLDSTGGDISYLGNKYRMVLLDAEEI